MSKRSKVCIVLCKKNTAAKTSHLALPLPVRRQDAAEAIEKLTCLTK